jgi:hypothetical protein
MVSLVVFLLAWQCTVLPRGLWREGIFATANHLGSCRAQLIPVSSSHVDVGAKRAMANLEPEFGGCGFGQFAAMEVVPESFLESDLCGELGRGTSVTGTWRM